MSFQPTVVDPVSLSEFVEHVLQKHASPSTLVVCSDKDTFQTQMLSALMNPVHTEVEAEDSDHLEQNLAEELRAHTKSALLAPPTLRFLASSQTLQLAFCPDITHLRAFLASYNKTVSGEQPDIDIQRQKGVRDTVPMLALLNLVALHRPTSAYSAQGLNRTFSVAIEAAHRSGARLVVAECPGEELRAHDEDQELLATDDEDATAAAQTDTTTKQSVWDEEVSLLNVTTKSFGAGDRGWVGRTVKLRQIAARWLTFEQLNTIDDA